MQRDTAKDGTVTETRSFTFTEKKVYRQQWPAYNLAQIEEKKRFLTLLHDLCKGLPNPPQPKGGRPRTPMSDMVFAACFKVFTGVSSRRFGTDFTEAAEKGFLVKNLHPVMVCPFLESEHMTPILKELVARSALPLRAVETTFAADSTGFSTSRFVRWFDEKYGGQRSGREWVKMHAICGTKTHVIPTVEILDKDAADCPQFKPLVESTAKAGFTVNEVSADKAYLSRENLELVDRMGGTAFIPFKSNSTPGEPDSLWQKAYFYYQLKREEFSKHYHQRSNAESCFSMLKAKFRDHVRSTSPTAMVNEVLCKVICHNICCLIMSQVELGIEPMFWGERAVVQEAIGEVIDAVPPEAPAVAGESPVTRFQACVGA